MKIQRSWVLCVLTILALVVVVHDVRAQSYPAGPGPEGGAYPAYGPQTPGIRPTAPVGNPNSYAPAYLPTMAPNGLMPAAASPYGPSPYAMGPAPNGYGPAPNGYGPAPNGYGPAPNGYGPAPNMYGRPAMPYGPQPAAYYDPAQGVPPQGMPPMDAMGPAPMGPAPMGGYYGGMPDGATCGNCGGYGCEACMGEEDFDLKLLHWLLPYSAGGIGAPRWYDISAEWVYMSRDDVADSRIFAKRGIDGIVDPNVLSTDHLEFDESSGVRLSVAVQLSAGNAFEVTYLGGFNWAGQAQATGNSDLYSIMSDYGLAPLGGFDDTDAATMQRIEYSSSLDSVEMNYRQRWVAPNRHIQGSSLFGVRYLYLDEDFRYLTDAPAADPTPGWMNYLVNTTNSMTGAQAGGDLWVAIMPGLSIGGEAKAGIYGNRATQRTTIRSASFLLAPPPVEEEKVRSNLVSFMGDASVTLLWRVNQNWTVRAGYTFLYLDAVALAVDNFNAGPPRVAGQRTLFIDDDGDVFYHGFTAGCEWMW